MSGSALIANENRHYSIRLDQAEKALNRAVQLELKIIQCSAVAEVLVIIGILYDVPVWGVIKDQIKLVFPAVGWSRRPNPGSGLCPRNGFRASSMC